MMGPMASVKRLLITLLAVFALHSTAYAEPVKYGDLFPKITLAGELTTTQKKYLGLNGNGPWSLNDIKADFVIIEVFSMYCPHCQAEAPSVNKLFEGLTQSPQKDKIKILGIGAGNSPFEVQFFSKKYKVVMPLFEDTNLTLHETLGQPGTPHFFLVSIKDGKTLYSETGRMKSPESFLNTLIKETGL